MKKIIIAGILILAVWAFWVGRFSTSKVDISADVFNKPYSVPFGEWVHIYLKTELDGLRLRKHYGYGGL